MLGVPSYGQNVRQVLLLNSVFPCRCESIFKVLHGSGWRSCAGCAVLPYLEVEGRSNQSAKVRHNSTCPWVAYSSTIIFKLVSSLD